MCLHPEWCRPHTAPGASPWHQQPAQDHLAFILLGSCASDLSQGDPHLQQSSASGQKLSLALVLVWCFFRIPKGGPNFSESFHFSCKLKLGSSWLDTRPLLQKKGQKLLSPFEPLGLPAQPCSLDCLQIFFCHFSCVLVFFQSLVVGTPLSQRAMDEGPRTVNLEPLARESA